MSTFWMFPGAKETKTNQWDFINPKSCTVKENNQPKKKKKHLLNQRVYSQMIHVIKGWYPKYMRNS